MGSISAHLCDLPTPAVAGLHDLLERDIASHLCRHLFRLGRALRTPYTGGHRRTRRRFAAMVKPIETDA